MSIQCISVAVLHWRCFIKTFWNFFIDIYLINWVGGAYHLIFCKHYESFAAIVAFRHVVICLISILFALPSSFDITVRYNIYFLTCFVVYRVFFYLFSKFWTCEIDTLSLACGTLKGPHTRANVLHWTCSQNLFGFFPCTGTY